MEETGTTATRTEPGAPECAHEPEAGTTYSVHGLPVTLRHASDFPADAKCRLCGQWVRCVEIGTAWHLKYAERM